MLPEVIGERRLIEALDISSSVLTPNGDGLNDEVYIRLVTLNVDEAAPHVDLFNLRGKRASAFRSNAYPPGRICLRVHGTRCCRPAPAAAWRLPLPALTSAPIRVRTPRFPSTY